MFNSDEFFVGWNPATGENPPHEEVGVVVIPLPDDKVCKCRCNVVNYMDSVDGKIQCRVRYFNKKEDMDTMMAFFPKNDRVMGYFNLMKSNMPSRATDEEKENIRYAFASKIARGYNASVFVTEHFACLDRDLLEKHKKIRATAAPNIEMDEVFAGRATGELSLDDIEVTIIGSIMHYRKKSK